MDEAVKPGEVFRCAGPRREACQTERAAVDFGAGWGDREGGNGADTVFGCISQLCYHPCWAHTAPWAAG